MDGVGVAVELQDGVVFVGAAVAFREEFSGWAYVGSVEEDHRVEACHRRVHGSDAGVRDEKLPRTGEVGTCVGCEEKEKEEKV